MKKNNLIDFSILENTAANSVKQSFPNDNCSYEKSQIRRATAKILDNVGFSTATQSSILVLSSIFEKYYEMLCLTTFQYANFGLFFYF